MDKYISILKRTDIFSGTDETEILAMLKCLSAVKKSYSKNSYIFRSGEVTQSMGLVLSGQILSIQEDLWGRRNIMAKLSAGDAFAEPFASSPEIPLNVNIVAESDCEILFLNINRILTACSSACEFHSRVIRNLVSVLAKRTLSFNEKVTHMSKKSTKEKLLSYLSSESLRQGKLSFDIPYDRQQLADYLCVERSAMSVELSKLQKEGVLTYNKNRFSFHTSLQYLDAD